MPSARCFLLVGLAAALASTGLAGPGESPRSSKPPASLVEESRQVTIFGVLASPDDRTIDPDLKGVAPQLRKLHPGHGFKLLGAKNRRLAPGQTVTCDLGDGVMAKTELVEVLDAKGKVRLRFALDAAGKTKFETTVTTPPNQLFFCDKELTDKSRLVIGVGAR
ncbi:MAG: hypothetical protein IRY99_23985 [Isosphaeraceae bacterium]|nr:hypothetical protein [Isosphaeraceae bacterium]